MNRSYFIGDVNTKWLKDGRKMKLLDDFIFVDSRGKKWIASKGCVVDGASIPKILWTRYGSPFVGKYRRASVIHDVYCVTKTEPHEEVHAMFYEVMLRDKTPKKKAKDMYIAVRSFGPRW